MKKGSKIEALHVKEEVKSNEIKLGFLGIIKPECTGRILHTWVSAQKP